VAGVDQLARIGVVALQQVAQALVDGADPQLLGLEQQLGGFFGLVAKQGGQHLRHMANAASRREAAAGGSPGVDAARLVVTRGELSRSRRLSSRREAALRPDGVMHYILGEITSVWKMFLRFRCSQRRHLRRRLRAGAVAAFSTARRRGRRCCARAQALDFPVTWGGKTDPETPTPDCTCSRSRPDSARH